MTGVGVVGSFGCGVAALAEALRTSRPVVSDVDRSAGYHLAESARTAALIGGDGSHDLGPAGHGPAHEPALEARRRRRAHGHGGGAETAARRA